MSSAIAILTYNRLGALRALVEGVEKHCGRYPLAIFDDCGQKDGTAAYLRKESQPVRRVTLWADQYTNGTVSTFLGWRNLGVAGNSNRALKWFVDGGWDHLCLLNDDLYVLGDFVDFYRQAHEDLGVGLFCFCDFDRASPAISGNPDSYKWVTVRSRGYHVKLLPRLTGIMLSLTRELVDKIGYFDAAFGRFGEEHCDYTYRARFAGFMKLDGQDQGGLDVEHYKVGQPPCALLKHQDAETSLAGMERKTADHEAMVAMREASQNYRTRHVYRPCRLRLPKLAGAYRGSGIPVNNLLEGYALVDDS